MKNWIISLVVLSLAGCAAITLPPEKLERSESNIRGAQEVGAANVPAAKLHMQLARDQTDWAKKAAADGDGRALVMLERADADAELAIALAHEAAIHTDAIKAAEDLKALQNRKTPTP